MQFPVTSGKNLMRQSVTVPSDLEGQFVLVLVAFQRWHQSRIDTWLPAIAQFEARFAGLRHYELPVLPSMNILSRTFINEGMRAGIPDPVARATTITLYVDMDEFLPALGVSNNDDIHLLLLDRSGEILWRTAGAYSADVAQSLADELMRCTSPVP
jgi:hypothetical protein